MPQEGPRDVGYRDRHLLEVLDAEGKIVGTMPEFGREPAELLRLYRALVLTRTFDTKAVALQRTGTVGHLCVVIGTGGGCRGRRSRHGAKRRLCSELS